MTCRLPESSLAVIAAMILLGGCATRPVNPPITRIVKDVGARIVAEPPRPTR